MELQVPAPTPTTSPPFKTTKMPRKRKHHQLAARRKRRAQQGTRGHKSILKKFGASKHVQKGPDSSSDVKLQLKRSIIELLTLIPEATSTYCILFFTYLLGCVLPPDINHCDIKQNDADDNGYTLCSSIGFCFSAL